MRCAWLGLILVGGVLVLFGGKTLFQFGVIGRFFGCLFLVVVRVGGNPRLPLLYFVQFLFKMCVDLAFLTNYLGWVSFGMEMRRLGLCVRWFCGRWSVFFGLYYLRVLIPGFGTGGGGAVCPVVP